MPYRPASRRAPAGRSVYIQLAADLGPDKVAETAHDMGITSKLKGYCAETLGGLEEGVSPLEMANAYATIASGGWRNRPTAITKVELPEGGSQLPRRWRKHRTKAFTDGVAYEAAGILQQNIVSGTGGNASIGCSSAGGKTGTTDFNTDAWFVGFTPIMSTAVWVGYPNDRTQMNGLYHGGNVDGGTFPAEIWGTYMSEAMNGRCPQFPLPKEPFAGSSFQGKYAGSGPFDPEDGTDDSYVPPTGEVAPEPEEDDGNDRGAGFDPDQYESEPQGPPETQSPGNQGGGTLEASPGGGAPAPGGDG